MLARRHDLSVGYFPVRERRLILRVANPLHAERTLLHDALGTHRNVRVQLQRQRLGERIRRVIGVRVVEPVEVSDLVRAVVAAVPRPDATVVDLAVESVRRTIRREYRANRFARGASALLAHHRQDLDRQRLITFATLEVALDAQPRHLSTALHAFLANDRNVVFRVTGGDARATPGAPAEIDGQSPPRMFTGIVADGLLAFLRRLPFVERALDVLGHFGRVLCVSRVRFA